jgi:hypothetical protein
VITTICKGRPPEVGSQMDKQYIYTHSTPMLAPQFGNPQSGWLRKLALLYSMKIFPPTLASHVEEERRKATQWGLCSDVESCWSEQAGVGAERWTGHPGHRRLALWYNHPRYLVRIQAIQASTFQLLWKLKNPRLPAGIHIPVKERFDVLSRQRCQMSRLDFFLC